MFIFHQIFIVSYSPYILFLQLRKLEERRKESTSLHLAWIHYYKMIKEWKFIEDKIKIIFRAIEIEIVHKIYLLLLLVSMQIYLNQYIFHNIIVINNCRMIINFIWFRVAIQNISHGRSKSKTKILSNIHYILNWCYEVISNYQHTQTYRIHLPTFFSLKCETKYLQTSKYMYFHCLN